MAKQDINTNEPQFVVAYQAPLSGGQLSGSGRWLRTEAGYVWTDDNGHLNFLDFDNFGAVDGFLSLRNALHAEGKTATEAFDTIAETEMDDNDSLSVTSGDLNDLRQEYRKEMNLDTITAAAPTEEDMQADVSYGITVDEDDTTVLELVKSDANGTYLRQDEAWINIDPEAAEDDYPTVYGTIWYDVSVNAIPVFDDASGEDTINKEIFNDLLINS